MRNPVIVLENLETKTKDDVYTFKRLFRNLYNPKFYLLVYSNIYSTEGNMTKGFDGNTIDGMSLARIKSIIEKIKNHTYKPNPVIRKYISKKNGKKRPLGIQSINGEKDAGVPTPNAYELYQGLRDMEVDTELVIFKGMEYSSNKPGINRAIMKQNLMWFSHYILGESIKDFRVL